MPLHDFQKCNKIGQIGEQIALENVGEWGRSIIMMAKDDTANHIEGKDGSVCSLQESDDPTVIARVEELASDPFLREIGIPENTKLIPLEVHPWTYEAKTFKSFIDRDNDGLEEHGTLPFSIWMNQDRTGVGWLYRLNNPTAYPKSNKPEKLMFVLIRNADDKTPDPYCCIVFDDFDELSQRLRKLATIDLMDWDKLPKDETKAAWSPKEMCLVQNMWYVPFDKICKLATVTMIGDPARLKPIPKRRISNTIQQARINFLIELAAGKQLPEFVPPDTPPQGFERPNALAVITGIAAAVPIDVDDPEAQDKKIDEIGVS